MKLLKRILFISFAAFLTYRSFDLLRNATIKPIPDYTFWETIILAILFNLFATGIFAFPGFVLSTNQLIPNSYYKISKPLTLSRIY